MRRLLIVGLIVFVTAGIAVAGDLYRLENGSVFALTKYNLDLAERVLNDNDKAAFEDMMRKRKIAVASDNTKDVYVISINKAEKVARVRPVGSSTVFWTWSTSLVPVKN